MKKGIREYYKMLIEEIKGVELRMNELCNEPKYKCKACKDTGRISWTDYSNGQGLDIEREDDCDKCEMEK